MRIYHYSTNLISTVLCSLVNLDKLEKRHKNTNKDSDASTSDDNASSKISRKSSKKKGKQTTKEVEESLMDHLKRIENEESLVVQAVYSSDEFADSVTKLDTTLVSNEALLLEANKAAKQSLLNSTDSDVGKRFVIKYVITNFNFWTYNNSRYDNV